MSSLSLLVLYNRPIKVETSKSRSREKNRRNFFTFLENFEPFYLFFIKN